MAKKFGADESKYYKQITTEDAKGFVDHINQSPSDTIRLYNKGVQSEADAALRAATKYLADAKSKGIVHVDDAKLQDIANKAARSKRDNLNKKAAEMAARQSPGLSMIIPFIPAGAIIHIFSNPQDRRGAVNQIPRDLSGPLDIAISAGEVAGYAYDKAIQDLEENTAKNRALWKHQPYDGPRSDVPP